MFQSAFTLRMRLVTGRFSPVGLTAVKWPMPCWSGVLPVAIVVQMTGLSSGGELLKRPYAPSWRSFAKLGSLPSDIMRSTVWGSIPSRPRMMTRPPLVLPERPFRRTTATAMARTAAATATTRERRDLKGIPANV